MSNDAFSNASTPPAGVAIDVSDATFQQEVIDRSADAAVVIDLWAPWCGPCKTLGPMLEAAVAATDGKVVMAKVNVDENPGISQAFQVQSIPAVYAMKGGKIVDGFLGAQPEHVIQEWIDRLLPTEEEDLLSSLIAAGDEASLRNALQLEPGNEEAIVKLAELLVVNGATDEALALLGRIPESERTRHIAAAARLGESVETTPDDDYDDQLAALLPKVKTDDEARQQFVDILELMGAEDPRTAGYRKQLSRELF